jgi:hypothetical protein
VRALDEGLAQQLAESDTHAVSLENVLVGHTGTEEPEGCGSMGILGDHRVEARAELGMNLIGSLAAELFELFALLRRDPWDLVVGRRRSDDHDAVDEIRATRRQSERDATARTPAGDPHRLGEQTLEHGGEIVRGGCNRRPLSGSDGMRASVPRAIDRDQPHVLRAGRQRVWVEAAGARGTVTEHHDALFRAPSRGKPGCSRRRSIDGDAAARVEDEAHSETLVVIPATFCRLYEIGSERAR